MLREQGTAGLGSCGLQLLEAADARALGVCRERLGGKAGSRKKKLQAITKCDVVAGDLLYMYILVYGLEATMPVLFPA